MSSIHIARNSAALGQFSLNEVHEGLKDGRFLPNDLHWQAGMADWLPLSQLGESPVLIAIDAQPQPAWERRQETGLLKAFVNTAAMSTFRPKATFADLRKDSSAGGAIAFYAATTLLITAISCAWSYAMPSNPQDTQAFEKVLPEGIAPHTAHIISIAFFALILGPIILSAQTTLTHYILKGLAGDDSIESLKTTVKAYLYPAASISLFTSVPMLIAGTIHPAVAIGAGVLVGILTWVITSIALASAHRTTTGKALAAYLISGIITNIALGLIGGTLVALFTFSTLKP